MFEAQREGENNCCASVSRFPSIFHEGNAPENVMRSTNSILLSHYRNPERVRARVARLAGSRSVHDGYFH